MKVLQANKPAINSTVNVGICYGITRVFHAKNIAEYLRMCDFCITHTEASRVKITNFIQPATTPQRLLRRGVRRRVPLRLGHALYLYYNAKPNMRL